MIISQTPLRISLAGGGTDLPCYCSRRQGKVLSTAVNKYIFVIIQERFDDQIHVNYARRKEVVDEVSQVRHDLAREAMRMAGLVRGFEVTTLADIPSEGSGLGSSSALTVGLLNAFHAYRGRQVDAETLARQACEIEIVRCGKPIGRQDQYIAAYGGLHFFTFHKDGSVGMKRVDVQDHVLRRLEAGLLLYYTNKTRSADGILAEARLRAADNLAVMNGIRALAEESHSALLRGDVDSVGRNLDRGWRLKKRLAAGVTDPGIDAFYARARRAGAIGGRITGAGGGGFFLLYAPELRRARLRKSLSGFRELPIELEPGGSKIVLNIRRRIWR
ncbi:MAG: GHMP kinase [Elusimicrobia bacterium]|nr:GHMP kinase [Elusimicrobiota bacterium]